MIEIINFEDRYQEDFRQMNLEWLRRYNLTEAHDLEILHKPRTTIIDNGGFIFLAMEDNTVAGCIGLMKVDEHEYQLIKMTVVPAFRGRGISKLLLRRCLQVAIESGADKITLLSNHQLEAALHLYKQFGFVNIPVGSSPFQLADVQMELLLKKHSRSCQNLQE